jgi:hypothetical protein
MVIVEDGSNNYEETVSLEYSKILQITPAIFSNLHRMGGK